MLKSHFLVVVLSALLVHPVPKPFTPYPAHVSRKTLMGTSDTKPEHFKRPLSFESNRGQADPRFDYVARADGYTVSLSATQTTFIFNQDPREVLSLKNQLTFKLRGASEGVRASAESPLPGKVNYLIGRDTTKHTTNVPTYNRVRYANVYAGIDIVYYGNQRQLEYDFIVGPGSNPNQILLDVTGATSLGLENDDLLATVNARKIRFEKPFIYQQINGQRVQISGGYVLKENNRVGFEIGEYDHELPLIIDPVLLYSSFLGGSGAEWGNDVKVDAAGNVWLTGFTTSPEFPRTDGSTLKGGFDVYVSKFNSTGGTLLLSTIIGASGSDTGLSLALDATGVYVSGLTDSQNYPTTAGAFQTTATGDH